MNIKSKFPYSKKNIIKYKFDILALIFLILFMAVLTYFLLRIDMEMGAYYVRDVFSYLNNSLRFAGFSAGLESIRGLSPFVPFLSSILFRMGFVYDWAIMLISSLFYILSGIGMYLILRLRFKEAISCCGAIILVTFSINIAWASKGMLDVPGMALSIWAIYFMFLAVKNNSKFFYLAFPILILGFFTRYTAILTLPVMLILILFEYDPIIFLKNKFKNLFGGAILGFLTTTVFLLYYHFNKIPLFFLSQSGAISQETGGTVSSSTSILSYLAKNNIFYYLNNLPIYMSTSNFPPYSIKGGRFLFDELRWIGGNPSIIAYIFLTILILGLIIYFYDMFKKKNKKLIFNKKDIKNKKIHVKIALLILLIIVFILTFGSISVIYSLVIFSLAMVILYRLVFKSNIKHLELDFLMLYWFMVNLIFYSSHLVKVDRYFIALTPPLAYFIILGLYLIIKKIKTSHPKSKKTLDKKNENIKIQTMASIFIIVILTIFTASCFANHPITYDNQHHDNILSASQEEKGISNWLIHYDPNYDKTLIWADRGGDFSFFLKMNILSLEYESNSTNFTNKLLNENVSYFISNNPKHNIEEEYKLIKNIGNVYLYERKIQ